MTDYRNQCFDCNKHVDLKTTRCLKCQRKHDQNRDLATRCEWGLSCMGMTGIDLNNPEKDPDGWGPDERW